ncbi:diguanylate cyclase [Vogesella sp. LIG4]|uniref:sensor domain-containing diguanylate cyclase n=1 Tax=Vogesella sp. LIG4 TaxID=1192162 RepID=UPI00081FA9BD|nr:diguanylate cyclase [Vogesella sp. LIG4]SCK23036.1 diguanylate cyclase (GGDEF) domain-containing protein [Vogesella sp. LIG4]
MPPIFTEQSRSPGSTVVGVYRPLSLAVLWQGGNVAARCYLLLAWLLSLGLCLWLGVVQLYGGWYGFQANVGELSFVISIYPPLTIATLWVLWFGYAWGALLAYLTTLMIGVLSGLSPGWCVLFAFANPLGLLVMAQVYHHVNVRYVPSSLASLLFFVTVCFISGVSSATGSFIWSYSNKLSALGAFQAWQGWWTGNFLQTVLTCGPLLLLTPWLQRWRDYRWPQVGDRPMLQSHWVRLLALLSLAGVLAFLWLSFLLADRSVMTLGGDSSGAWQQRAMLYRDSAMAVYWVLSVLLFAVVFLGYRLFRQRTLQLKLAAERVAYERDLALRRQSESEVARQALHQLNLELAARMNEVEQLQAQLHEQASRDPLTALYNRRYLHQRLPQLLQRAERNGKPLCLVLIDLDHFKVVNDQHGHAIGDAALKQFAALFCGLLQPEDIAARYGGEEFCLVLPQRSVEQVEVLLHNLQAAYGGLRIACKQGELSGLSFSAGIAFMDGTQSEDALLQQADAALYQAKAQGRHTWRLYEPWLE